MGEYVGICPRDDGHSRIASDWYTRLSDRLKRSGHIEKYYLSDKRGADYSTIRIALAEVGPGLVLYFGHGTADAWTVQGKAVTHSSDAAVAKGKAVVSVACKTGRNLGPDAVNGGVVAWLGFTIPVPTIAPHGRLDPLGDAIVDGIAQLGNGGSMADARAALEAELRALSDEYRSGGRFSHHPNAVIGFWACGWLADNVSLAGATAWRPL
ncbi:C25 family cysteine peptidase [Mycolicibacterium fortuitum]|uniref:C25 family cysteine peptidase n=2 Tax=Mycolicibacterium fortuitum TaxID=1766 RepID=A0AAE5AEP2_MYCFO|nr:C25 family cysteine peptidase [Mycolicibacterium fortuitum]MCV7143550.1 hypothetical protein [Mycolicibacterium fortuitum]MDV7193204.1 C25 family cysteine peptidase [Mycolicibacterium fortuitum]MDV7206508.1 C25 family cysteine peptidase [Mycolicibacterium fortuitum]MDV7228035.1 C25 family cysteine peptidase [Mycolicibacterium fortuitum]MDV7260319.1 C25 family cysteine peptidase [Mycolicibacterium fortuitum]